jgi:alpha-1,3-mannosyltransferase
VGKFFQRSKAAAQGRSPELTPENVLYFVATANFMGILCARTLHYQFYSWWVACGGSEPQGSAP